MEIQELLNDVDLYLISSDLDYIASDNEARYLYRILKGLLSRDNQLLLNRFMTACANKEIYAVKVAYLQGREDQVMQKAS